MNQPKQNYPYTCEGTCQAKITQKQYDAGLTKCGTKECTFYGKPFKKQELNPKIS